MDEAEKAKYREARTALRRWYYFDHIERFDLGVEGCMSDADFEVFEEHYEEMMRMLCKYAGHVIEDDMCGKPEHRFCIECATRQPYAELSHRD